MAVLERLEIALRSSEPGQALRAVVKDLAREGFTKPQINELLERLRVQLRMQADYRESDEELILDIMDNWMGGVIRVPNCFQMSSEPLPHSRERGPSVLPRSIRSRQIKRRLKPKVDL
jgi:hypothetical protein